MPSLAFRTACALLVLTLTGSLQARSEDLGPGQVAALWFTAFVLGESDAVIELSTPETRDNAGIAARARSEDLERTGMKGKINRSEIEGWLKSMQCETGHSVAFCKPESTKTYLVLRKVHGQWLVDYRGKKQARSEEPPVRLEEETGTPEEVTGRWLIAIVQNDEEELRKLCTKESIDSVLRLSRRGYSTSAEDRQKLLESAQRQAGTMECRINNEEAICRPRGKEKWVQLRKVNGTWKIDFKGFILEEDSTRGTEL